MILPKIGEGPKAAVGHCARPAMPQPTRILVGPVSGGTGLLLLDLTVQRRGHGTWEDWFEAATPPCPQRVRTSTSTKHLLQFAVTTAMSHVFARVVHPLRCYFFCWPYSIPVISSILVVVSMSDATIGRENSEIARAFRPVLVTFKSCPFERPSKGLVVPCVTGGVVVAYQYSIVHAFGSFEVPVQTFNENGAPVFHRACLSMASVPRLSNSLLHGFIARKKHLPRRCRPTKSHHQHCTEQREYSPGGVFPERRTSIRVHGRLPSESQFLQYR